jgi:hypothetical protein
MIYPMSQKTERDPNNYLDLFLSLVCNSIFLENLQSIYLNNLQIYLDNELTMSLIAGPIGYSTNCGACRCLVACS